MTQHDPTKPYKDVWEDWEAPDWAPKDAGAELFRDGNWVTVRDYLIDTHEATTALLHMCHGGEWKLRKNPPQLVNGCCNICGVRPPDRVIGFNAMIKWDR